MIGGSGNTDRGESRSVALYAGAKAMLPVLIGIAPFAAVAGLAGSQNGLSLVETAAFSLFSYAGAAQIAALDLMGAGAAVGVVIATALVINLRFLVYSAALAPMFADSRCAERVLGSYLMTDHSVALTLAATKGMSRRDGVAFYLGAGIAFWITWQICAFIGSLFGSLPDGGVIAFAVPASFLALLVPHLREWPKTAAAVVAAVVAIAGAALPANLGMILGTVAGIAAGVAFGWRSAGKASS